MQPIPLINEEDSFSVVRMLHSPQCQRNFFPLLAGWVGGVEVETTPFDPYYREMNFY